MFFQKCKNISEKLEAEAAANFTRSWNFTHSSVIYLELLPLPLPLASLALNAASAAVRAWHQGTPNDHALAAIWCTKRCRAFETYLLTTTVSLVERTSLSHQEMPLVTHVRLTVLTTILKNEFFPNHLCKTRTGGHWLRLQTDLAQETW